jgi:DNA-binding transcriptional LysR family regulator
VTGNDLNRSREMEVFARVAELGAFSAAAQASDMTPSGVSRLVTRLESRLGARLLVRSTRKLVLTREGRTFYDRCVRILAAIDQAEQEAGAAASPQGRIRVNVNVPFALHHLFGLLPAFLADNPQITLDVTMTDEVADLIVTGTDVAIRTGPLAASRLVARKLGESAMAVVATPEYLRKHGAPRSVADLSRYNLIGFNFPGAFQSWPFRDGDALHQIRPSGSVQGGDGEVVRQLALQNLGFARLALFHVGEDLRAGRLVSVLEDCNPGDRQSVHAVYVGQGGHVPSRVRIFLDYLATHVDLSIGDVD